MIDSKSTSPEKDSELVLGVESVSAVFAHDIATPLTTARMNAELLQEYCFCLSKGLQSEEAESIPHHIRVAIERAPELIKNNIESIQRSLVDYKQYLNALKHESENASTANTARQQRDLCLRILLVDDEDIHHDIAGAVLGTDHIVTHEKSGEAALLLCENDEFDVILMDMKMPGLSGEQTTEKLRAFVPVSTLILGLTNLPMGQTHDTLTRGGFDGFMEKPLRVDIFNEVIDSLLRKSESENNT